jgi:tetratricopeptide (TPR) repeat protein/tRNA A-37 threonylcarbamoyl transferase component Bud32
MSSADDPTRLAFDGPPSEDHTHDGSSGARSSLATPASGTKVDRYVLLEPLGTGGMAVVYLAYDPKLRRNVAIKLVKAGGPQGAAHLQARLVREAQALAQVSHPHLVQVHDVGTWGDRVFIAMEYVRGPSLSQWLMQRRRWREVVEAVLAAGRGLAAAHDAGLVHRDFKPANVLVGDDGRVRVVDFGLARVESSDAEPQPELAEVDPIAAELALTGHLTESGTIMGTPAYMAPEQHEDEVVDARSDQFSLCATLYEAVYGLRPFRGDTARSLLAAKRAGPPPPPPRGPEVPGWLRQAIARGLSPAPADRFPSVHALLHALERGLVDRRRTLAVGTTGVSLLAVGALGYSLSADHVASRCEGLPALVAWDEARSQAVHEAFAAIDVAHRDEVLELAGKHLDARADAWSTMQRDACEATHVRGEQSGELLDLRVACLGRRAVELDAVTSLLAQADADVIDHAVELVLKLPPLEVCADADSLRAAVARPEDPAIAAEVEAAYVELARANALATAGKTTEAAGLLHPLVERVRAFGYAPLRAESLLLLGDVLETEDPAAAERSLREAVVAAGEGKDDRLVAVTFTQLVFNVGQLQTRHEEALSLLVGAEAAVARAGATLTLRIELETAIGAVEFGRGRFEEATRRYDRAQALVLESGDPDDPRLRTIFNNHGAVMLSLGRLDEAREQLLRALEHNRRAFGPHHPYVADPLLNLGNLELEGGNGASALARYREALTILQGVPNQNRRRIANVLSNATAAAVHVGDVEAAERYGSKARTEMIEVFGPDHPNVAAPLDGLGMAALVRGDLTTSAQHFARAVALLEPLGKQHPNHAMVSVHLGQVRVSQGRFDEGAAVLDAARGVLHAALPAEHPAVLAADAAWAEAELERGHPEVARPLLERVTERITEPNDAARFAFALARALARTGGDRSRALALARDAEAFYAERGLRSWQDGVAAWIAAQAQ